MLVIKTKAGYRTSDGLLFPRFGDASGHCRRIALISYLEIIVAKLKTEEGAISMRADPRTGRSFRDELLQLDAAVEDVLEEDVVLTYAADAPDNRSRRDHITSLAA